MPTILIKGGFEVRIYLNDHIPTHVHVFKGSGEAKINMGDENLAPEWVSVSLGMSDKDAVKALKLVADHQLELLKKWREYHG
ncbi:DUF4160 domain-containing protein [Nostoc sp. 'Peltigera malacea cyanobiont' DB3992]|uniref:DUF4160 domain-containing protein n=1 Tax=Nostoc sp. 'Peltigera malacea cyanobiont' DB3992 TaxID=1206980 RepID=UPI000C0438E8|nr:DUF4160 domain-containing protein [Nostoc sp. 'Peltigera malacea cyanobiont' DB3992]PHM06399.1 hypothetical protein CK516_33820 [Nostoc sp. 'Peltigera malacea cyanobiont' DB3992]